MEFYQASIEMKKRILSNKTDINVGLLMIFPSFIEVCLMSEKERSNYIKNVNILVQ